MSLDEPQNAQKQDATVQVKHELAKVNLPTCDPVLPQIQQVDVNLKCKQRKHQIAGSPHSGAHT